MEGKLVENWSEHTDKGDFWWLAGYNHLGIICPGCGEAGMLRIKLAEDPPGRRGWNWDGNVEQPTLNPSVHMTGGCGWHGYLVKGKWVPVDGRT